MSYSAKQIDDECAYVEREIQDDAAKFCGDADMDVYDTTITLFRICAEAKGDELEIGRRVRELIFLPAVRQAAVQRLDEAFYDVFASEVEEHRHFDDKERARDLRKSA